MENNRILIVEDELKTAHVLSDYLKKDGFVTHCITNGNEVVPFIKEKKADLVLLDIMLPVKSGIEVCREIRQFSSIPVIMISARGKEYDRIIGLEIGADDYVSKPFSPREVVARVKALLRRLNNHSLSENTLQRNNIHLDEVNKQIKIDNKSIDLTSCEFFILKQLFTRPGFIFSREQLMKQIDKSSDNLKFERRVNFHVKNLRKKFEKYLKNRDIIQTVYGSGYKLVV